MNPVEKWSSRRPTRHAAARRLVLLVVVLIGIVSGAFAEGPSPLSVNVTVTWDLGLRVGVEYRPWDHVGFCADVGSTLFSFEDDGAFILTYNAFVMLHAFDPGEPFQLSACIGLPDGRTVFVDPLAGELAFGASIRAAYRVADRAALFLRVGGGVPIFHESGTWRYDRPSFPLGLWPDLSLGLQAGLGGRGE
jgi:hypothetical protein